MNKKIVFIGPCFGNINNKQINNGFFLDDLPANIFGWKIVKGISENNKTITVINDLRTHYFPKGRLYIKKQQKTDDGIDIITVKKNKYLFIR